MSCILDEKIKEKELIDKSNISNLIKNSDFNRKLKTLATKAELKVEQEKIVKMQTYDWSYLLGKKIFWWWWFLYVWLSTKTYDIRFKRRKGHWLRWKSKEVYSFKLYITAFLHSIKLSGYKMGIEFDKDPLDLEQKYYTT